MFTGIIEEVGTMKGVRRSGNTLVLDIQGKKVLEEVQLGDSIAVNGVCLTVISYDSKAFQADVMPETYRKTNLKDLKPGDPVNLERAMAANGRYGGHLVQGHVDGVGVIRSKVSNENAVVFTIELPSERIAELVLPTGSITIDGISLTVVQADHKEVTVSIIPHTLSLTVLGHKAEGDTVNIECDIIGKYVKHLLNFKEESKQGNQGSLTEETLQKYGFI